MCNYRVFFTCSNKTDFVVVDDDGYIVHGGLAHCERKDFETQDALRTAFVAAVRKGGPCGSRSFKGGSEIDIDFPGDCTRKFKRVVTVNHYGNKAVEAPPPYRSR